MRGRTSKIIDTAVQWLKTKVEQGPVSSKDIRDQAPASWQTMNKAKTRLNLMSYKTRTGWYWFYKGVLAKLPTDYRGPEPELVEYDPDAYYANTAGLTELANNKTLEGWDIGDIILEAIASCARWPMPKPYSKRYIESVIRHAIEGTPLDRSLNPNEGTEAEKKQE
jgi:hypothetical protein